MEPKSIFLWTRIVLSMSAMTMTVAYLANRTLFALLGIVSLVALGLVYLTFAADIVVVTFYAALIVLATRTLWRNTDQAAWAPPAILVAIVALHFGRPEIPFVWTAVFAAAIVLFTLLGWLTWCGQVDEPLRPIGKALALVWFAQAFKFAFTYVAGAFGLGARIDTVTALVTIAALAVLNIALYQQWPTPAEEYPPGAVSGEIEEDDRLEAATCLREGRF